MHFLLEEQLPVFWCPGCGHGIILAALIRALKSLKRRPQEYVAVTGIGCWGKADDYLGTNTLHGTHGRALAFATGVKTANPELSVFALMGDGDCATIGGNHFLHAARRNVDVTAIVANNFNYGMTGGQYSATTPVEGVSSTSVYGNPEESFDLCRVAEAAGAGFVARSTVYHVHLLEQLIREALQHKGFSLVEVFASCPVHFGRHHNMPTPVSMMEYWREHAVRFRPEQPISVSAPQFLIGKLSCNAREDFSTRYHRVQQSAQRGPSQ